MFKQNRFIFQNREPEKVIAEAEEKVEAGIETLNNPQVTPERFKQLMAKYEKQFTKALQEVGKPMGFEVKPHYNPETQVFEYEFFNKAKAAIDPELRKPNFVIRINPKAEKGFRIIVCGSKIKHTTNYREKLDKGVITDADHSFLEKNKDSAFVNDMDEALEALLDTPEGQKMQIEDFAEDNGLLIVEGEKGSDSMKLVDKTTHQPILDIRYITKGNPNRPNPDGLWAINEVYPGAKLGDFKKYAIATADKLSKLFKESADIVSQLNESFEKHNEMMVAVGLFSAHYLQPITSQKINSYRSGEVKYNVGGKEVEISWNFTNPKNPEYRLVDGVESEFSNLDELKAAMKTRINRYTKPEDLHLTRRTKLFDKLPKSWQRYLADEETAVRGLKARGLNVVKVKLVGEGDEGTSNDGVDIHLARAGHYEADIIIHRQYDPKGRFIYTMSVPSDKKVPTQQVKGKPFTKLHDLLGENEYVLEAIGAKSKPKEKPETKLQPKKLVARINKQLKSISKKGEKYIKEYFKNKLSEMREAVARAKASKERRYRETNWDVVERELVKIFKKMKEDLKNVDWEEGIRRNTVWKKGIDVGVSQKIQEEKPVEVVVSPFAQDKNLKRYTEDGDTHCLTWDDSTPFKLANYSLSKSCTGRTLVYILNEVFPENV